MKHRPPINTPVTSGYRTGAALLWAGLLAVLAYVGLSALWALAEVALLVLVAIVLAVVISALVQLVQRANVSRGVAVVMVVSLTLLIAGTASYFCCPRCRTRHRRCSATRPRPRPAWSNSSTALSSATHCSRD